MNPFPIHHKLTHDHFFLTSESKMRNKLAEEAMNGDMLHLMEEYQKSLLDGSHLQATVDLLKQTSILVSTYRDNRPITEEIDSRLKANEKVLKYFQDWEESISKQSEMTNSEKEKALISHQTRMDIKSMLLGFDYLCKTRLKRNLSCIVPSRVNSDAIENVFCQQRGIFHGANTNPTYAQYLKAMNSVILGQPTLSRKSNTGGARVSGAEPLSFRKDRPLNPRKKPKLRI